MKNTTRKSPFKIKSPKMKKSLNSSSERIFIRESVPSIKKKSPKKNVSIKSPKNQRISLGRRVANSPSSSKKKVVFIGSSRGNLDKLEEKAKSLYGSNNIFDLPESETFIPSQPMPSKKDKKCNDKCNILTNQCYIDCIDYITTNLAKYIQNPDNLVDDIFIMIEPRMNKDVYIQNVNTANLYNNMVDYTSQKWSYDDIKTFKSILKQAKTNNHYKPVNLFLKEVKFYKWNNSQQNSYVE